MLYTQARRSAASPHNTIESHKNSPNMNKFLDRQVLWPLVVGLSALSFPALTQAEDNVNTLYFQGGTNDDFFAYRFFLASGPEWIPSEETHTVEYRGTRFEIPNTGDLEVMLFYDKDAGIEDLRPSEAEIILQDEKIVIRHATGAIKATIYDTFGAIIISENITDTDECEIDLSALGKGIYIITVGNQTFKFIRK